MSNWNVKLKFRIEMKNSNACQIQMSNSNSNWNLKLNTLSICWFYEAKLRGPCSAYCCCFHEAKLCWAFFGFMRRSSNSKFQLQAPTSNIQVSSLLPVINLLASTKNECKRSSSSKKCSGCSRRRWWQKTNNADVIRQIRSTTNEIQWRIGLCCLFRKFAQGFQ